MKPPKLEQLERGRFADALMPDVKRVVAGWMNSFDMAVQPPLAASAEEDLKRATDIDFNGVRIGVRVRQIIYRKHDEFSIRIKNNGHDTEIDKLLRGVGPPLYCFGYADAKKCRLLEAWLFDTGKIIRGGFLEKEHGIYVYRTIDNGDGTAALYLPIAHRQFGRRSLDDMGCILRYWNPVPKQIELLLPQ